MLSVRKNYPTFVTGATGFIGGKIVERLLAEGRKVRALSRRPLPELEAKGVEVIPGDLNDIHALERGCKSADAVFHVAGRVGVWGPRQDFFQVNVEGTRNLLGAAQRAHVPRFIYTSSPSVVYNGGDLRNVDESAPRCMHAPCAYPTSKAAAEIEVLKAHSDAFRTVALRPHLVWGPGDRNVVPRVMALAHAGKLKIVGHGKNQVDVTHITNVVDAHLLAEGALVQPNSPAGGKAYFITNGQPVVLWDWINQILTGVGIAPVTKRVPLPVAYAVGGALEAWWNIKGKEGDPPMTRFVAKELATDHWFNLSAARRDLAYHPLMTMAQGTEELILHYRNGHAF